FPVPSCLMWPSCFLPNRLGPHGRFVCILAADDQPCAAREYNRERHPERNRSVLSLSLAGPLGLEHDQVARSLAKPEFPAAEPSGSQRRRVIFESKCFEACHIHIPSVPQPTDQVIVSRLELGGHTVGAILP